MVNDELKMMKEVACFSAVAMIKANNKRTTVRKPEWVRGGIISLIFKFLFIEIFMNEIKSNVFTRKS